jgi:L-serine deaminase
MGTAALTTRGMKKEEMGQIAKVIAAVLKSKGDLAVLSKAKETTKAISFVNDIHCSNRKSLFERSNMMEFQSCFDIIGPIMVGPSSSHTAGVVSIGKFIHEMMGGCPEKAMIGLFLTRLLSKN